MSDTYTHYTGNPVVDIFLNGCVRPDQKLDHEHDFGPYNGKANAGGLCLQCTICKLVVRSPCSTEADHEFEFYEDPEHEYTGYLERCKRCSVIIQIVQ